MSALVYPDTADSPFFCNGVESGEAEARRVAAACGIPLSPDALGVFPVRSAQELFLDGQCAAIADIFAFIANIDEVSYENVQQNQQP